MRRASLFAIAITTSLALQNARATTGLAQAEAELRTTFDTIPALVVTSTLEAKLDWANARWREEGFSEQDLRAGPAHSYIPMISPASSTNNRDPSRRGSRARWKRGCGGRTAHGTW